MIGSRRYPRYSVNLRLRLQLPSGELETTTDEISLAGFSAPCSSLPESGTPFTFAMHLPDGNLVSGTAAAVRISPGMAGFSCEFTPDQQRTWATFVQQEHAQGGVWRMLSRWVTSSADETEAARSVHEKSGLGERRLHMVGENGEAYRIAFEKHPSTSPDTTPLASTSRRVLNFARRAISRVLVQDVLLKRTPQAQPEPVRLVEMLNGGYGYLVENPGGKPALMGLHGAELMVIEANGKSVFPYFTADELERIAADTFRREPAEPRSEATAPAAVGEERFADAYQHQQVDTQRPVGVSQAELRTVIAGSQRVQTRTYGGHTLKLFPDVWLEVQRPGAQPQRGFAMQDGSALCMFVLVGQGAPRVLKLEANDLVFTIREGPDGLS